MESSSLCLSPEFRVQEALHSGYSLPLLYICLMVVWLAGDKPAGSCGTCGEWILMGGCGLSTQSLTVFQRSLTTMQIQVVGLLQFAVPLFPTAEVRGLLLTAAVLGGGEP